MSAIKSSDMTTPCRSKRCWISFGLDLNPSHSEQMKIQTSCPNFLLGRTYGCGALNRRGPSHEGFLHSHHHVTMCTHLSNIRKEWPLSGNISSTGTLQYGHNPSQKSVACTYQVSNPSASVESYMKDS